MFLAKRPGTALAFKMVLATKFGKVKLFLLVEAF